VGTLAVIATLAQEPTFIQRVKAAMITAASAVAGEAVGGMTTTVYGKRQQLAVLALNNPDIYVSRFAWATAINATVSSGVSAPVAIASTTAANPTAVTTAAAHGYTSGDQVVIAGHATNTSANGCWTVTVTNSTTFTIPSLGIAAGGATGTAVKQPPDSDIQFQVNSVWDDIAGRAATD
jgi:hypothetical protein